MQKVVVVGAGTMGNGIAHTFAQFGYSVLLIDANESALEKGLKTIQANFERQVQKQQVTEEQRTAALSRITTATSIDDRAADADLVVEAASENFDIKSSIFRKLDEVCKPSCILASNTSSISITRIAAVTKRADKVIGMHFMNPVPVMKLVEIIRGLATSEEVYQAIKDLSLKLEKTPVEVNDFPGFVSNRILMPMINEAIYTVFEGVASPEAVDEVMKLGMNHPMGPLTLADFIGLDTCLYIMETLHEGFGDDKYRPCPLLRKYVKAGWLGKKSGRGFYTYEA